MSKEAVDQLLARWDESGNPILAAAAGQMRAAIRARRMGSKSCELCGRSGTKAFIRVRGSDAEWKTVCGHRDACDARMAAL